MTKKVSLISDEFKETLLKEVEQNRRDRADDNQKINQLQLEILNLKTSLQTEKQ